MSTTKDKNLIELSNRCITVWEIDSIVGFEKEVFDNYYKYGKLVTIGCLLNSETQIKISRDGTSKKLSNLIEDGLISYKLINKDLTTQYFSNNDHIRYIYEEVSSNAFFVNYFENIDNIKLKDIVLRIENLTYSYYQNEIRQTLGYYVITGIKLKDEKEFKNIQLDSTANSYVQIYQQNFIFEDKLNMELIEIDNKLPS